MKTKEKGSVVGGVLMIAGCCVGAGMLGLPVMTSQAGFIPSLFFFLLSWMFMTATGLLVLEVNLWFQKDVSFVTMAGKTLGRSGQAVSWFVFLFLFYCLMVAYIAGTGSLFVDLIGGISSIVIPQWQGSLLFILLFGSLIYLGTKSVDWFNRLLMAGLLISYSALVLLGSSHVKSSYLLRHNWKAVIFTLPIMIISFGYHNLVPSLTQYLKGNVKKLCWTIILGSTITLLINLIWEAVILGIVPLEGEGGFLSALNQEEMVTQTLKATVGSPWIVMFAEHFAFFAIATSFLSVALSFVDFLSDGLHIPKTPWGKVALCALVLLPPFLFTFVNPQIFLTALNVAGGYGAVVLFGILPALMVWKGRYQEKMKMQQILPGGKPVLCLIILFAITVMLLQAAYGIGLGGT